MGATDTHYKGAFKILNAPFNLYSFNHALRFPPIKIAPIPATPPLAPRCHALLPAAGSGSRAGTALPKQYQALLGRPLLAHTLAALRAVPAIDRVTVVIAPDDVHWTDVPGVDALRCGGATRAESVFNGLQALREAGVPDRDWVLVHDAARCLVTPDEIGALIEERPDGGAKASLRAKDPIYRVDLVAAQFNGGGPACAAGLNLKTGAENFYARLVAAFTQRLAAVSAEKKSR